MTALVIGDRQELEHGAVASVSRVSHQPASAALSAGILAAITGGEEGDAAITAERVVDSLWYGLRGSGPEIGD